MNTHPQRSTEAEKSAIKRVFLRRERLRPNPYSGHCCLDQVKGEQCKGVECRWPSGIPTFDHGTAFRRGQEHVIVYQPYEFTDRDRERLTVLCAEHGLKWRELPEFSWQFPNWTTLIVIDKNLNSDLCPQREGDTR